METDKKNLGNKIIVVELAIMYGLLLICEWQPFNPYRRLIINASFGCVIAIQIVHFLGSSLRVRMFTPLPKIEVNHGSFRRAISDWMARILLVCLVMVILGALAGTLHKPATGWHRLPQYFFSAFVQQWLLQIFIFRRLLVLLGENSAWLVASGVFALAHAPNLPLMVVTAASGLLLTYIYTKYKSFSAVIVFHWLLGLTFSLAFPPKLTWGMRVGYGMVLLFQEWGWLNN